MRSLAVPLTLAGLGLAGSASAGTVAMPFSRRNHHASAARSLMRRDGTINLEAVNNITGAGYYAEFEVGTPGQTISFQLDTGSSDTWVNSVDAGLCHNQTLQLQYGPCQATFDPDASDTFDIVAENAFNISYLDGSRILGDYFNDTLTIGDSSIENQQLGLAHDSVRPTGIMGLGFSANVAASTPYATVIDNMLAQGLINTAAFSLYLNDIDSDSGTVLFGGIDSEKFIGDLAKLPVVPEPGIRTDNVTSYNVELQGVELTAPDDADGDTDLGSFSGVAILDSGSTISLLPDTLVRALWDLFDVRYVRLLGLPLVDCAWSGDRGNGYSVDFQFDGKTISVPLSEMIVDSFAGQQEGFQMYPLDEILDGFDEVCLFGVSAASEQGIQSDEFALLGDTFLRSAYVVYDLANEQLGIAQANLNSTDSNIVEFDAGSDDIPDADGVDSQEGGQSTTTAAQSTTSATDASTTETGASTTASGTETAGPTETDANPDNAAGRPTPPLAAGVAFLAFLGAAMATL